MSKVCVSEWVQKCTGIWSVRILASAECSAWDRQQARGKFAVAFASVDSSLEKIKFYFTNFLNVFRIHLKSLKSLDNRCPFKVLKCKGQLCKNCIQNDKKNWINSLTLNENKKFNFEITELGQFSFKLFFLPLNRENEQNNMQFRILSWNWHLTKSSQNRYKIKKIKILFNRF